MQTERWQQVQGVYVDALDVAPNQREAFLREACAGNNELRREVGDRSSTRTKTPEPFCKRLR